MTNTPIIIASFPRAILHVDGDAFFASVEQAITPQLRGKPVVTGKERGIIACANYEAKKLGVKRGITLSDAKKLCPDLVVLPSDYETYSLFSKRMFNIMRRFTPIVEEYSIDEAFADITGMRRVFRCSYEDIARRMQEEIARDLGITVSVGLSLSKGLAKLCSKFRKPAGFTAVPGKYIHLLLQRTSLETVWGFGPNTVNLLAKMGLNTAYDFVMKPEPWATRLLGKNGREIWHELRGTAIHKVCTEEKSSYATIIKSKTFTPPSTDKEFIYARLVKNAESAFMKARRFRLRPKILGIVLRRQDFSHDGMEAKLTRATSSTMEIMPVIREVFEKIFTGNVEYRATMMVLGNLENDGNDQFEFFEDRVRIDRLRSLSKAVDEINSLYGKHTVRSASTLFAGKQIDSRQVSPARRAISLKGENLRQRLAIPRLDIKLV
ncbi:MAG: DNA polymerase IV [Verrucomicrobia bacterium]|nr:DNA polymerase IV [Verrucomicrobiota bacterium]